MCGDEQKQADSENVNGLVIGKADLIKMTACPRGASGLIVGTPGRRAVPLAGQMDLQIHQCWAGLVWAGRFSSGRGSAESTGEGAGRKRELTTLYPTSESFLDSNILGLLPTYGIQDILHRITEPASGTWFIFNILIVLDI